jgi:hypothetical protein
MLCFQALEEIVMDWQEEAIPGKKTIFLEPCVYKNDHFTKAGSGQT